jgi:hypothetical protein
MLSYPPLWRLRRLDKGGASIFRLASHGARNLPCAFCGPTLRVIEQFARAAPPGAFRPRTYWRPKLYLDLQTTDRPASMRLSV